MKEGMLEGDGRWKVELTLILVAPLNVSSRGTIWAETQTGALETRIKSLLKIYNAPPSLTHLPEQKHKSRQACFHVFFFLQPQCFWNPALASLPCRAGFRLSRGRTEAQRYSFGFMNELCMGQAGRSVWKSISFSVPIIASGGTTGEPRSHRVRGERVNLFLRWRRMLISNYPFAFRASGFPRRLIFQHPMGSGFGTSRSDRVDWKGRAR